MERLVNIERFAVQREGLSGSNGTTRGIFMLLRKVEKFLRENNMAATKFGRLSAGDPRFVLDLRMGRTPRAATEARTLRFMAEFEARSTRTPRLALTRNIETKEFSYAV